MNLYNDLPGIHNNYCCCSPTYSRKTMHIQQQPKVNYSVSDYIYDHGIPNINYGILDLSFKGLTRLDGLQQIPNLGDVDLLNLSQNYLKELPEGIFNGLINLNDLNLSHNQIKHTTISPYKHQWIIGLPTIIFRDLPNLTELNISNNNLYDLPLKIFEYAPNLQDLDVSWNFFPGTEQAFRYTYLPNNPNINIQFKPQKQRIQLPPKKFI